MIKKVQDKRKIILYKCINCGEIQADLEESAKCFLCNSMIKEIDKT
jgi:hypothetical protein